MMIHEVIVPHTKNEINFNLYLSAFGLGINRRKKRKKFRKCVLQLYWNDFDKFLWKSQANIALRIYAKSQRQVVIFCRWFIPSPCMFVREKKTVYDQPKQRTHICFFFFEGNFNTWKKKIWRGKKSEERKDPHTQMEKPTAWDISS